jgi:GNAT superfamily N-acetyltransferase
MQIREMDSKSESFVGTCTHVEDTPQILRREEIDLSSAQRITWLQQMHGKGSRVKVAFSNDQPVAFLHLMPIEVCPWGPIGEDLLVIPCLTVIEKAGRVGVGSQLVAEAVEEARRQGKRGLVSIGYYHDCWFMPAPFFERCGFRVAERRAEQAVLWEPFDPSVAPPRLLTPNYHYVSVSGKVVIDLFWNTFCPTSSIEAQRVREVAGEFGEAVKLNEYCADDHRILLEFQIPRGIFINGKEIWWGHEAPKEGIRNAVLQAL